MPFGRFGTGTGLDFGYLYWGVVAANYIILNIITGLFVARNRLPPKLPRINVTHAPGKTIEGARLSSLLASGLLWLKSFWLVLLFVGWGARGGVSALGGM